MAGMLPGVECARRRRFHQSGGSSDSQSVPTNGCTRRSSFCLYASNHETHHFSTSLLKKGILKNAYQDDHQKLGTEAREAKERLDERLRTQRQRTSESKRHNSKNNNNNNNNSKGLRCGDGRSMVQKELQLHTEVYSSKRNGSRKFSWAKLSWKASDQDECAVCLESFRAGETLVHLPCAHRFHSVCLVPWLENNAHCPCCRMGIITHH